MPGEKNKTFVLRIDAQTMEALEAWAEDEFRSINGQLQWIIADALRRSGRLKRPRAAASGTPSSESAATKPAATKPAGTKPAAANSAGRRTEKEPAGTSPSSKSAKKQTDEASSAPASAEPKNQESL